MAPLLVRRKVPGTTKFLMPEGCFLMILPTANIKSLILIKLKAIAILGISILTMIIPPTSGLRAG